MSEPYEAEYESPPSLLHLSQEAPRLNMLNGEPHVRQPLLVATVTIAMTAKIVSLFMAGFSGRDGCSE